MKKKIVSWIQGGGTYADGLELFDSLARPVDLDRCGGYLHGGTDGVRRAMLEGELRRILRGLRDEPQLYPSTGGDPASPQEPAPAAAAATAAPRGIHIAAYKDLPPEQQAWYDRLRELAPLIGSLHADLTRGDAGDSDRQETARELCRLDTERRSLWQRLDAWAEGRTQEPEPAAVQEPEPEPAAPSAASTAEEQLQLLRRRKRLQDNILTARRTVERWQGKEGGGGYVRRAEERLEAYRSELSQVQTQLKAIEGGQQ